MLKYYFSGLLILSLLSSIHGQEKRIIGLRVGCDVSRLALLYFEPERREMEFSLDMEAKKNIYPVLEYGQSNITLPLTDRNYSYEADGFYFRLGMDRNFMKKLTVNQYEMIFAGFRYGYSHFTHSAGNITILDPYWGDYVGGSVPPLQVQAHWVEVTAGIRGEIFKNFFIGWSFRGKVLLAQSGEEMMRPYVIPGFGRYKNKRSSLGMSYSLYYRIPIYKTAYNQ